MVLCRDKSFYTGISWNPTKRVVEHNQGIRTPLQKSKRPVQLVFQQEFETRKEAAKREKEIKGWRREKKQELINNSLH